MVGCMNRKDTLKIVHTKEIVNQFDFYIFRINDADFVLTMF